AEHGGGPHIGRTPGDGPLSGLLRGFRAIEQTLALSVEVTQEVRLKSVSQNTKQQVAGQVRGWAPPEHRVPTGPERTDVEFAQARDLDVDCLAVWLNPTVLGVRHDGSGGAATRRETAPGLSLLSACDLVDPLAVDLFGSELQVEALAHDAGKKAAHRVLLPAGCPHHRVDCRTCGRLQHRDNTGLFGAWLAIWPLRIASGQLR